MKRITHLFVALSLIGTICNGADSTWAKTSKKKGDRASQNKKQDLEANKERLKELKAKKSELSRKRRLLVKERTAVANRLDSINDQLSKASVAKVKRSISDELVVEEVNATIAQVELDLLILNQDKRILAIDEQIFDLEKTRFQDKYGGDYSIEAVAVDKLPDTEVVNDYSYEKELLGKLEPAIFQYWGKKRIDLNQQIINTRRHRLKLWEDELNYHKSFLTMKSEDFASGQKRGVERQNLLKKYFSLKNSRQMVNNELIMLENESWQAGQRMKYELSSLYRRLSFAKRYTKGKESLKWATLRTPVGGNTSPDKFKVSEYAAGIIFSDLYNWATKAVSTIDDTSARSTGIKSGDEIVFVDKAPVIGSERSFKTLLRGPEGNKRELVVLRSGKLYRVKVNLDYRPKDKSHPQIIKNIKAAEKSGSVEDLAKALMDELDYVSSFSRDLETADSTCDQILKLLENDKSLSNDLRIRAYVACSIHSLSRMGQCLAFSKRTPGAEKTSESATFMNQADEATKKAIELASGSNLDSVKLASSFDFLKLANEYRKHYDFRHIGSKDMLEKAADTTVDIAVSKSEESPYTAASVLNEVSEVYELCLKNYKRAGEVLKISWKTYSSVLPAEAKEITDVELVLSRNLSRSGDTVAAIDALEKRLATLEKINQYSRKSQESGMYEYVATLKDLGRLYSEEDDFDSAFNVASKIIDTYKELDAAEDYTYVEALLLAGRSSVEKGKAKKAIAYLTDAMERLEPKDKTDCLIALARAYQTTGKARESRLLCFVLKDYLKVQFSEASTVDDGISIGDQAVEVAQILDSIDEHDSAVSLFDFALFAYTSRLSNLVDPDNLQAKAELKKIAEHLSQKLVIFNAILDNAGNSARASSVDSYSKELNTKLAKGGKFEIDWLVRVP